MRYHEFKIVESLVLLELSDRQKEQLRQKYKKENNLLTDDQINYYLDRWDQYQNTFDPDKRDITRLSFSEIERLIDDAVTKTQLRGRGERKTFDQTDDLIYNKNNLTILKGDLREKCIQYGEGYTWCISRRDASNMFFSYRMRLNEPMFYFVFDKDKPETDIWHAVVIYVDNENVFHVATANNPGDKQMTWAEIVGHQPKLKGLESVFVHQPLTPQERADYEKYGRVVDLEKYSSFSLSEKYKYIQFGHVLTSEQQEATPNELIGVYAKQMPTKITPVTLKRLKSGDRRKVISDVVDPTNEISPVDFAQTTFGGKPWSEVGLPEAVVDQAHKKILKRPESAYYYARDVIGGRWPEAEPTIAQNSELAYQYARDVIGGRWPEAEPTIAQNPAYAYAYAQDVIKGRWPEAEPIIARDPKSAYYYARDVIKGRWPEAEPIIAQGPYPAYAYARDVIGGRWPEAEPIIAEEPESAYNYAREVIKDRWPEAEPTIAQYAYWAYKYARDMMDGERWPEAEPIIAEEPESAYAYAQDVIKGRWPEAEPTIAEEPDSAYDYARYVIKGPWPEAGIYEL